MRVLLVSYYAEAHLASSSAQNTRLLAAYLAAEGHEVRVICAASTAGSELMDGYRIQKLPLSAPGWSSTWLGVWRPDPRVRDFAREAFDSWRPHVIMIGAWNHLTEFGLEAHQRGIPVVQVVHDYSLICFQQWLLDSSGRLCTGPTSREKCFECLRRPLGPRAALRNRLLSLPGLPSVAGALFGPEYVGNHHVASGAGSAWAHMQAFRGAITLFIAQAPSVVDLLGTAGVSPSRCRLLPQFIGDEKLEKYSRPEEEPCRGRPLRLIYVGRWSSEKGPDLLVDAFSAARAATSMELWIIARNADPAALESERATPEGDTRRIRVVNDAHGHRVSRLLAQCDVCVVPSRCRDLAGRAVPEANAQGVPVVVSSSVGNRYLVEDGVNGRIFPTGDGEALRRCIEELAASPDLAREWSKGVAEPVRREAWQEMVAGILTEAIDLGAS